MRSESLAEECERLRAEVASLRGVLDALASDVFDMPGESEHFTPRERAIMSVLYANLGKITRHQALYDAVYSARTPKDEPNPEVIKAFICKARAKLRHHVIDSVFGVGYVLRRKSGAP